MLRTGSTGQEVIRLQRALNGRGFGPLLEDGVFGAATERAVRQYQASEGITVDGVVGPVTESKLGTVPGSSSPQWMEDQERLRLLDLIPDDAPDVVRRTLELAIGDLGAAEDPDGSNTGPAILHLVGDYNRYWWVLREGVNVAQVQARGYPLDEELGRSMAWCGMAVTNWIREALDLPWWDLSAWRQPLAGHPFRYYFGGPSPVEEWAMARDSWVSPVGDQVIPSGAAFTISRGGSGSDPTQAAAAGHIGLVICDNGDGTITTIEGNVSNRVGSYRRKKAGLRGFTTWW